MLTFIVPAFLWLLLLLPLLWLFTLLVRDGGSIRYGRRFWASLLLRSLILAALVLALAGTQVVQSVDDRQVVFLLDSSDSVALSQRARAEAYIQDALTAMPANAQAGIVVFGEHAQVERLPGSAQMLGTISNIPPGTQTNIADAIQLGLTMLPAEAQRRLVLLSDGGENSGDAQAAARLAAAQGVPIDVIPLNGVADGLDAQISGLELPATAGEGQQLRLVVDLESRGPGGSLPTEARLQVEQRFTLTSSETLVDQPVELTGEPQRFTVTLPPPTADFNRYVVRLLAPGDIRQENNLVEGFTLVQGRPRLLLITGNPDAARNLNAALMATDLLVEQVPPAQAPTSLGDLIVYDAVILVDVSADELGQTAAILPAYVRDLGRGLAMIGGTRSFGMGGWRNTPVEEALPVEMNLRPEVSQPPVSIVVIIDVSGSMAQEEGGYSKVQLAAAGAARIAAQLRDEDEITVIPFDTQPQGTVGPLPGTQRAEAIERVSRIGAGGGGINIYDALQEAAGYIRDSEKPVRHIITLTDGSDTVQQEGAPALVDELRAEGVTVSSVAIGQGKDVPFLEDIVQRGVGRFFLTEQARDVPEIMAQEATSLIQPLIIEEEFVPRRFGNHPILRGVEAVPPLYGYVATTPKESAQVLLASDQEDPVLAVWQYGLGRSLAWTPDMQGKWATDWVRWPEFQRVTAQMITWLLPPADGQQLTLDTRTVNGQLLLTAQATSTTGTPATGLRVAGQMVAGDGQAIALLLKEVTPGQYRLALPDAPAGVYLVQLVATDAAGQPQAGVTGGAAVPFSGEYRSQGDNPALLELLAATTAGRTSPSAAAVYDDPGQQTGLVREAGMTLLWLALLLLPLDVAVRRLFVGRLRSAERRAQSAERRTAGAGRKAQSAERRAQNVERRTQSAGVAGQAAQPETQPSASGDPLERLREAQARARRRARGEE